MPRLCTALRGRGTIKALLFRRLPQSPTLPDPEALSNSFLLNGMPQSPTTLRQLTENEGFTPPRQMPDASYQILCFQ